MQNKKHDLRHSFIMEYFFKFEADFVITLRYSVVCRYGCVQGVIMNLKPSLQDSYSRFAVYKIGVVFIIHRTFAYSVNDSMRILL